MLGRTAIGLSRARFRHADCSSSAHSLRAVSGEHRWYSRPPKLSVQCRRGNSNNNLHIVVSKRSLAWRLLTGYIYSVVISRLTKVTFGMNCTCQSGYNSIYLFWGLLWGHKSNLAMSLWAIACVNYLCWFVRVLRAPFLMPDVILFRFNLLAFELKGYQKSFTRILLLHYFLFTEYASTLPGRITKYFTFAWVTLLWKRRALSWGQFLATWATSVWQWTRQVLR